MRPSLLSSLVAVLLLGSSYQAIAGGVGNAILDFQKTKAEGKATATLLVDNDSLLLKTDDGFYTSGFRFSQSYSLREANERTTYGWRIGQELYTASDINLPPALVGPPDHPYAGWLYAGGYKEIRSTDGTGYRIGLDIGCLGPCAGGKRTQTALHRLIRQPLPQAWSKQVKNEIGAVVYADFVPVRWTFTPTIDVSPNLHARFGNIYTDAGAGVTLRAGELNVLPDQPTLHGFVRVDGRAVAYNAPLQGGYFSDANVHTVKPKRLVGEIEIGIVWLSDKYGVTASILRRGNEIASLSDAIGAQNFARLLFSYAP